MSFSKPFELRKAGDSDLQTRGLSHSNYKKLDLDDFNHGAYKNTVHIWFRDLEFNIRKDIAKIHKNNRFTHFTLLPFIWKPCFQRDSPEDSEHFGIPSSPNEFTNFQDSGLYTGTPVEFLSITRTRIRTRSQAATKADASDPGLDFGSSQDLTYPEGEYKVSSSIPGDKRTPEELGAVFCKFFTGLEPERLPFKAQEKRLWTGCFETEIVAEIRDALKIAIVILLAVIPSLYEGSFKQNRIKNWSSLRI